MMSCLLTIGGPAPFKRPFLKGPLELDYRWAALCMMGAVFFIFRDRLLGH